MIVPFDLDLCLPKDIPRDMRDYEHFMQLCSSVALIDRSVEIVIGEEIGFIATIENVLTAVDIYDKIIEMTRAGVGERVLDFYWNVIVPAKDPSRLDLPDIEEWTMKMRAHSTVAKTVEEAKQFVETGFEYVCTYNDVMLFRKRK